MKAPSIAAQWGAIRRVYPIYTAVSEEFALGPGPYPNLDELTAESEAEAIGRVQGWLAEMDELIQPHQFRYILERTDILSSEDRLRALVLRYLRKDPRTDSDRQKLHYLLNQYVCVCSPPSFRNRDVRLEDVAQVLEPVLGEPEPELPEWLRPLCRLVVQMPRCASLQELQSSILGPGRELKNGDGEQYFSTAALLVFTHFNYCARRDFTRLLNAELQAIDNAVQKLDANGVEDIDCTSAGFGERETLTNIRLVLDELRTSTSPAYSGGTYSSDSVVERIQALRAAIEAAVRSRSTTPAEAGETRIAGMESQIQQLSRQLAQLSTEFSGLRKIVAKLVAQPQALSSAGPQASRCNGTPPPLPAVLAVDTRESVCAPPENAPAPMATPPSEDVAAQVQRSIGEIRKALAQQGKSPSGLVKLGSQTVLLNAREIDAMNASAEPASLAQRAIAVRSLLLKFVETADPLTTADLSPMAAYARDLLADLQKTLGSSSVPMRDALASSARQLRTVLQHAEQAERRARLAQHA